MPCFTQKHFLITLFIIAFSKYINKITLYSIASKLFNIHHILMVRTMSDYFYFWKFRNINTNHIIEATHYVKYLYKCLNLYHKQNIIDVKCTIVYNFTKYITIWTICSSNSYYFDYYILNSILILIEKLESKVTLANLHTV